MKKLRLLLWEDCKRNCEGCSNNDWALGDLPIARHYRYDEILLTGGEPLLYPENLLMAIHSIRPKTDAKIFLYTARLDMPHLLYSILLELDGVCITLHDQGDVKPFLGFHKLLRKNVDEWGYGLSLRLNVFNGVKLNFANSGMWKIKKNIKWIKNCPLPEGEVFMRWRGY